MCLGRASHWRRRRWTEIAGQRHQASAHSLRRRLSTNHETCWWCSCPGLATTFSKRGTCTRERKMQKVSSSQIVRSHSHSTHMHKRCPGAYLNSRLRGQSTSCRCVLISHSNAQMTVVAASTWTVYGLPWTKRLPESPTRVVLCVRVLC